MNKSSIRGQLEGLLSRVVKADFLEEEGFQ